MKGGRERRVGEEMPVKKICISNYNLHSVIDHQAIADMFNVLLPILIPRFLFLQLTGILYLVR